jgi:DNA-binding MarR family transcriptional regulator
MTGASDPRTANLLAALSLQVAGRTTAAAQTASERAPSDTTALVALAVVAPGASQDTVGLMLGLSQSGVTRLVDRLAQDGLVRREPGPDHRTVAVRTTAAGDQVARRALSARQQTSADFLAALDADEQEQLTTLLEKLLGGAVTEPADPWRICRMCDTAVCHDLDRCPVTDAARVIRRG